MKIVIEIVTAYLGVAFSAFLNMTFFFTTAYKDLKIINILLLAYT